MLNNNKIVAVILAAGASTRMGEPKQLLPWRSTTLLNHCINEVIQANIVETVIVLWAYHEEIKATINQPIVKCLINPNWETGMGSSIALTAEYLKDKDIDGLLVVLADQPFVNTNFLNKLIKEFTPNKEQIIATTYNTNTGVPIIFDKQYFKELSLLNGKQGAKELIQKHTPKMTKVTPNFNHQDIDTPEAYLKLHKFKN